jgi:hypothetical protein
MPLRASVGSTEASNGRLARFGRIDRRTGEVCARSDLLLYACHDGLENAYFLAGAVFSNPSSGVYTGWQPPARCVLRCVLSANDSSPIPLYVF